MKTYGSYAFSKTMIVSSLRTSLQTSRLEGLVRTTTPGFDV